MFYHKLFVRIYESIVDRLANGTFYGQDGLYKFWKFSRINEKYIEKNIFKFQISCFWMWLDFNVLSYTETIMTHKKKLIKLAFWYIKDAIITHLSDVV